MTIDQLITTTFKLSSIPGRNRTSSTGEMKRYYLEVNPELLDNAKEIAEKISGVRISNASLLRNSLKFFIDAVKLSQTKELQNGEV